MTPVRVAVVGSGAMARIRAEAFASLGEQVLICGVASRHLDHAARLAKWIGCQMATDHYPDLLGDNPDAILVEVPHRFSDEVVRWALAADRHVLIGGPLATSGVIGHAIATQACQRGLVVEAGYEARYKPVWTKVRSLLDEGTIGTVTAVQSVALYNQDPHSWYYDEELSGGMLITHVSYAFLNPLRWLLGTPTALSAFAHRKIHTQPGRVRHENCVVAMTFPNNVLCSMLAGYLDPAQAPAWNVTIFGHTGNLEVHPGDTEPGHIVHYPKAGPAEQLRFAHNDAFARQAQAFVDAIHTGTSVRNPPSDAVRDIELCELIGASADAGGRTQQVHEQDLAR